MESTRIIAVRHGETAWNVGQRIQGHLDIELNETGRNQARLLAKALAGRETFDAIYCSDLARARETAQIVADALHMEVIPTPALRERSFGEYQGMTFPHITETWPEQGERWRKRDPDWAPPGGGESLRQLQERLVQTVNELAARHMGQHIALFTHGGVLDMLYRIAAGMGLQDARTWQLGNAAVNRLLWTPEGLSLVGWGDETHLEGASLDESTA
ncbi:MAG: histidine phosphatase family protein [Ottowia sp.]|uniref:histidine phosphatase family protein n=1 Tax=Ottowia sp. TaxID=1898956 RepID=UPI003C753B48